MGITRYRNLLILFACIVFISLFGTAPISAELRYVFNEQHMGTYVRLVFYAENQHTARRAADLAYDEIEALEKVFSFYDDESEIRRLTAPGAEAYRSPVSISAPLYEVLLESQRISQRTNGQFDVTVGPLVRLWNKPKIPTEAALAKAAKSVGYENLKFSTNPKSGPAVSLAAPRMRIDVSAIAKGYIADRALAVLRKEGYTVAMVDAGGDIALGDSPPKSEGWAVEIGAGIRFRGFERERHARARAPGLRQKLNLSNCGIATSQANGPRRTINPRTGHQSLRFWHITVIAKDCLTADAYATAGTVVGPRIIEQVGPNVQMKVVDPGPPLTGEPFVPSRIVHSSEGFGEWQIPESVSH